MSEKCGYCKQNSVIFLLIKKGYGEFAEFVLRETSSDEIGLCRSCFDELIRKYEIDELSQNSSNTLPSDNPQPRTSASGLANQVYVEESSNSSYALSIQASPDLVENLGGLISPMPSPDLQESRASIVSPVIDVVPVFEGVAAEAAVVDAVVVPDNAPPSSPANMAQNEHNNINSHAINGYLNGNENDNSDSVNNFD